jgi:uncharacterized protein YraI
LRGAPLPSACADLAPLEGPPPPAPLKASRIAASSLNVRSGPGTGYAIVGTARSGEIWCTRVSSGGWRAIDFGGSSQRWFSGGYTTAVTIP